MCREADAGVGAAHAWARRDQLAQCNSVRPTYEYSRARRAARGVVVGAPARGPLLLTRPAAITSNVVRILVRVIPWIAGTAMALELYRAAVERNEFSVFLFWRGLW